MFELGTAAAPAKVTVPAAIPVAVQVLLVKKV